MDIARDVVRVLLTGEPAPGRGHPLLDGAGALAAGEPRRALRRLGAVREQGDARALAAALRVTARTLDLNWYPGGAGADLAEGDAERLTARVPRALGPDAALAVFVAARFLPRAHAARSVAENARTSGDGWASAQVLRDLERAVAEARGADAGLTRWVRAHLHLEARRRGAARGPRGRRPRRPRPVPP
ncbi:hypothetical protein RB200_24115 [Streptomyces sp. PmtG]